MKDLLEFLKYYCIGLFIFELKHLLLCSGTYCEIMKLTVVK